jgi:hypothetical protein
MLYEYTDFNGVHERSHFVKDADPPSYQLPAGISSGPSL